MLEKLTTEARNPESESIDQLSALEIAELMNRQDVGVAKAVHDELPSIARAIEVVAERIGRGGRLIYMGAGTSGRLGVLDAAECPPTFNTPPEMVLGLIAGGSGALVRAVEGAEDRPENAIDDLQEIKITEADVLVGIATSGRTPYVIAGLEHARTLGAFTVGFSCNPDSQVTDASHLTITPIVGPEVISGSTRLKAGTATKMVLNMISTGAMVRLGKTYGNLMVDLKATNYKLTERTKRIVSMLTGLNAEDAVKLLDTCQGELKTAIVVHRKNVPAEAARRMLEEAGGHLRRVLEQPE